MKALRHSPVLAAYREGECETGVVHDMKIGLRANEVSDSANYLVDLSAIRKRLFIGAGAAKWLNNFAIETPAKLLGSEPLAETALVVRLHREQYLLIDGLDDPSPWEKVFAVTDRRQNDVLISDYESAEFGCGGPYVHALFAEQCAMDLSASVPHSWIATRLAHCEVTIRRLATDNDFRLICSLADARFLFGILREVALEQGAITIGYEDYRTRMRHEELTL